MDKTYEAPQGRLLPTLVIFLFIVGVLYTLFLLFQQYNLNKDLESVDASIGDVNLEIETLKQEEIEELFVAQELKDRISEASLRWSKVIRQIQDLTPVSVFVSSYSASSADGGVQISGLGDSFGSVADMISSLSDSPDFSGVFVPSVTVGTTSEGQKVVSFSLQLQSSNP